MVSLLTVWADMKFSFFALLVTFLAGCATTLSGGSSTLEQRVEERWALLLQGKLADAYTYISPASRELITLEKYLGSVKSGMWRSAKISKVSCESETLCTVEVDISYTFKPKGGKVYEGFRVIPETWRRDAGVWWNVPDQLQ